MPRHRLPAEQQAAAGCAGGLEAAGGPALEGETQERESESRRNERVWQQCRARRLPQRLGKLLAGAGQLVAQAGGRPLDRRGQALSEQLAQRLQAVAGRRRDPASQLLRLHVAGWQ